MRFKVNTKNMLAGMMVAGSLVAPISVMSAPSAHAATNAHVKQDGVMYATANVNVRTGAGKTYPKISVLKKGNRIGYVGKPTANGWQEVLLNGKPEYVSARYLTKTAPKTTIVKTVTKTVTTTTTASSPQPSSTTTTSTGVSAAASKAVSFAYSQLGKPYVYGATGPNSYDCSGLTQAAWKAAGVSIPRVSNAQLSSLTRVSKSALRPGDIVGFYSGGHVGIYIGNGKVIHAPHTGTVVKIENMSDMPYYTAVRPA